MSSKVKRTRHPAGSQSGRCARTRSTRSPIPAPSRTHREFGATPCWDITAVVHCSIDVGTTDGVLGNAGGFVHRRCADQRRPVLQAATTHPPSLRDEPCFEARMIGVLVRHLATNVSASPATCGGSQWCSFARPGPAVRRAASDTAPDHPAGRRDAVPRNGRSLRE